jgi:hypothetical protein
LKGKWRRTAAEEQDLAQLHAQLDEHRVLGQTDRERLMLEAADEFLARERTLTEQGQRRALRDETKRRIGDMWAQTESSRRSHEAGHARPAAVSPRRSCVGRG